MATGSGHLLWPRATSVEDVPHDFVVALDQAIKINSWFENLSSDEIPPSWMWPLDWELHDHFQRVKEERDKKYGSSDDTEPDDEMMDHNVYADRFK